MSTLRKTLGEPGEGDECSEWITNVPLRGYRFNGRVLHEAIDAANRGISPVAVPSLSRPPIRLTRLIGREAEAETVLSTLEPCRLVTIVGTGGIGKTSVAVRVTERYGPDRATETAFVDLAPLTSQEHVLSTLARSLGASADLPDTIDAIVQRLKDRNVLALID